MDLLRYNFICVNCEKEYYTYISRHKYQEFAMRTKSTREIFENYDNAYSQIFISCQCSDCLNLKPFCQSVNFEDDFLYNRIEDLERNL